MKRPSFQFYPGDWLSASDLRSCSVGARGLWMDMICLMHQGNPYGHLTLNNKGILPLTLARMVGASIEEVEDWLVELEIAGVFSRLEDGTIYSRRMIRDEEVRQLRAAGGVKSIEHPNVQKPKTDKGSEEGYPSRVSSDRSLRPSPSSSPSSSSSTAINNQKENSTEPLSDSPNPPVASKPPNPAEIVFAHWKEICNHPKAVLDAKRRRAIQDRLKQFSVEDCKRAIDGCRASPWHQGANDRGKVFDDIDLIFRDAKHVEDFIRVLEQTPATARGIVKTGSHQSVPKTAGNIAQMESWLNSRRASNG